MTAKRSRHVHAQSARRLLLSAAQSFFGGGKFREHAPAVAEVVRARGRHRNLARRAVEELETETLLEPAYMRADHGARQAEFVGGAREGAEFGDPAEGLHGLEVFHAAIRQYY